jgi:DNA primase
MSIDLDSLKANTDLQALVERDLGAPVKRAGKAWQWYCPFHADHKTPSLTVYADGFKCFGCGAQGDAIGWLMLREGVSFLEACERLGAGNAPSHAPRPAVQTPAVKEAPAEAWQDAARAFVLQAQQTLWGPAGERARAWLAKRGLSEATIIAQELGFHGEYSEEPAEAWGLDGEPVKLARGIVIPCAVAWAPWYVKIRRAEADGPKYLHVRGGRPALYGADAMLSLPDCLVCEGELDALLALQELGDLADCVTFGSASDRDIRPWLAYLLPARRLWIATDADDAGDAAAAKWATLTARARRLRPTRKDITDMHTGGADLRAWLRAELGAVPS